MELISRIMTNEEKRTKIIELLLLGRSYRDIAKKVKVSLSTISEIKSSKAFAKEKNQFYLNSRKYLNNRFKVNRKD